MKHHLALSVALVACASTALTAACSDDEGTGGASSTGGPTATQAVGSGAKSSSTGGNATAGPTSGAGSVATTVSGSGASGSSSTGNAAGPIRFVAMGDQGKGNEGQQQVADAIQAKCAADGCDFVQLLGDNIYDSGVDSTTDPLWEERFETPYQAINLDFWAVLGNHDYGADGAGSDFGKGQNEVDYTMVSAKWKMPAAYWQRSVANVDFFGLDTNMSFWGQADAQKNDVSQWIAASTAQWKIALGHHTYLSNGKHGNAGSYEGLDFIPIVNGANFKDFMDDAVCGKVDVYLCGHDHSLQWLTDRCGATTELIVTGAGASSTELNGDNPSYFETLELGFLYVVIDGNTFTGEVVGIDGTVMYTRTITK